MSEHKIAFWRITLSGKKISITNICDAVKDRRQEKGEGKTQNFPIWFSPDEEKKVILKLI